MLFNDKISLWSHKYDYERFGRIIEVATHGTIEKIHPNGLADRTLKVYEIVEVMAKSLDLVVLILIDYLGMRQLSIISVQLLFVVDMNAIV